MTQNEGKWADNDAYVILMISFKLAPGFWINVFPMNDVFLRFFTAFDAMILDRERREQVPYMLRAHT